MPVGADDHWAVHSLASTTTAFELLVEDPPGESDDGEPPQPLDPEIGFPGADPEERLLQNFYQVVGDLERAREFGTPRGARQPQPLDGYRGYQLPGTAFWLGALEELFAARNENRLTSVIDELTAQPVVDEPAAFVDLGLALVVLPVTDA